MRGDARGSVRGVVWRDVRNEVRGGSTLSPSGVTPKRTLS